jgi:hypothetical protein
LPLFIKHTKSVRNADVTDEIPAAKESQLNLLAAFFRLAFYLVYFSTLQIEAIHSSEMWLTFNGLRGFISQKTEFFITTAVRISDST